MDWKPLAQPRAMRETKAGNLTLMSNDPNPDVWRSKLRVALDGKPTTTYVHCVGRDDMCTAWNARLEQWLDYWLFEWYESDTGEPDRYCFAMSKIFARGVPMLGDTFGPQAELLNRLGEVIDDDRNDYSPKVKNPQ